MFEDFTDQAVKVVMLAQEEARALQQSSVGTEQLLLGLLREEKSLAARVLTQMGVTLEAAREAVIAVIGKGTGPVPTDIPFTPKTKYALEQAFQEARHMGDRYINPNHLLLGITRDPSSAAAKVLLHLQVEPTELRQRLQETLEESATVATGGTPKAANPFSKVFGGSRSRSNSALAEFGKNLTEQAAHGQLDPMIGRHAELERVIQILGRRTKNNPILLGEPGVGKTAIAEGLAQRIVDQDVPESLLDTQVISLDMSTLVAGSRFRGDFEERLTQILAEVREQGKTIVVIDEIHTLIGGGAFEGSTDAANLMKPALARGELQCLGATTLDEYRRYIERDAALERRFQPVRVEQPSVEDAKYILRGLRHAYEQHHRVEISDAAIEAAVQLSDRYISDRFLPDKAIDLIDEAGSRVNLRNTKPTAKKELKQQLRQAVAEKQDAVKLQDFAKASQLRSQEVALEAEIYALETAEPQPAPVVTDEDIAQVVSAWVGIPVTRLTESESAMLLHLEDVLHERVIGQTEAVQAVSRSMRRARVGLQNPNRPIASFIFSGPTGVGKTELAKALAAAMFGSEEAMIRLDMSEFM
ncbi:MAG: ATP-dependent Clp protease ATP-binding subunit, partial [Cyanobacteria bacterium P01_H01_bin.121]